jgi:hypothetical protein
MSKQTDLINVTDAITVDDSQNVGIGTSSPTYNLHVEDTSASLAVISGTSGNSTIFLGDTADNNKGRIIYTQSIDTMKLLTNGSEAMRIDSSGKVLVNRTTAYSDGTIGNAAFQVNANTGVFAGLAVIATATTGTAAVGFVNPNGSVGNISLSGTSTSYNTSSDYRLKTDAQPMTGASARVQALNPVNFEWIADGTRVDGFLAHEAQAVVPEAVTGTKDAMGDEEYEVTPAVLDEDGNVVTEAVMGTRSVPDYQGIDQSKLVPLLTAALQEALTKIDDMETRLAALEAV